MSKSIWLIAWEASGVTISFGEWMVVQATALEAKLEAMEAEVGQAYILIDQALSGHWPRPEAEKWWQRNDDARHAAAQEKQTKLPLTDWTDDPEGRAGDQGD
jgi:hypothetical protein